MSSFIKSTFVKIWVSNSSIIKLEFISKKGFKIISLLFLKERLLLLKKALSILIFLPSYSKFDLKLVLSIFDLKVPNFNLAFWFLSKLISAFIPELSNLKFIS